MTWEFTVISDGSTDETDLIAAQFRLQGRGLNAGIARATGEILFFTDVRQRLEPGALRGLVARLADPRVGGASG